MVVSLLPPSLAAYSQSKPDNPLLSLPCNLSDFCSQNLPTNFNMRRHSPTPHRVTFLSRDDPPLVPWTDATIEWRCQHSHGGTNHNPNGGIQG